MIVFVIIYVVMFFVTGYICIREAVNSNYQNLSYVYRKSPDYFLIGVACVFWPVGLPILYIGKAFKAMERRIKSQKRKEQDGC